MSGPEHYAAAEERLEKAESTDDPNLTALLLEAADVHVRLAQVAATAQIGSLAMDPRWSEVLR